MKNLHLVLVIAILVSFPDETYCQNFKKSLPDGWEYKELKFPEGKVFIPVPVVPKEDFLTVMVDEFENNKKMVTMMIDNKGYSVYLMPQLIGMKDSYLNDDLIGFIETVWVKVVIAEFIQFENINGRKFYYGLKTSSNNKKVHDYTTVVLLDTTLYTLDVSSTEGESKNREFCRMIASYIYSPDERVTSYFNPAAAEDRTGQIFRETFENPKGQFLDYESYYWNIKDGEMNFSSADSNRYSKCPFTGVFSDFTLTANVRTKEQKSYSPYGLFFRGSGENFYLFSITQDGYFQLAKHAGKKWINITDPVKCSNDLSGNLELKVTCKGNKIQCYINKKRIIDAADDTFSKGEVGFYAEGGIDCAFDDFYIGPAEVLKDDQFAKEDFKGNVTLFRLGKNLTLNNGELVFSKGDKKSHYYMTLPGDYSEGTIRSKIKWLGGKDDCGYGITFGNSNKGVYSFFISPKGFYSLSKTKDKWLVVVPWSKTDEILPDDFNELKVTFLNNALRCYINDELIISLLDESINPGKIGLSIDGNVECSCNYFEISPPDEDDREAFEDYKDDSLFENFEGEECTFDESESFKIKNGKFYFINGDKNLTYTTRCDNDYLNYTVSIKVNWESGASNEAFGLFFGKAEGAYYTFTIRKDGIYSLSKWTGYLWKNRIDPAKSDLIENGINVLKVTVSDNKIIAHINGIMVANIEDGTIERGYVGVFASGGVDASFDDFRIGDPEKF